MYFRSASDFGWVCGDRAQGRSGAGVSERLGCIFLTCCHIKAAIYKMNEFNQPELIDIDKHGVLEGWTEEPVCAD